MNFYIATRLERLGEQQALAKALCELGHVQTYDWTTHGSVQDEGPERIRQVAIEEGNGVLMADLVIVMLPGGRGTHTEFGMAIANKIDHRARRPAGQPYRPKRIVIIGDRGGEGERTCAFYHHSEIDAYFETAAQLVGFIRGLVAANCSWRDVAESLKSPDEGQ